MQHFYTFIYKSSLLYNLISLLGMDPSSTSDLKRFLHQQFEMKDLGHLSYLLGLKVSFDSTDYYLFKVKYASNLLFLVGLTDIKIVFTPLEINSHLTPLEMEHLSMMSLSIVSLLAA